MTEKNDHTPITTKEKIFAEAVKMFSDIGYSEVSVRDIANSARINISSLYFHYSSKESMLNLFYDYYMENWQKMAPNINEILQTIETAPLNEIFEKLDFRFDPEIEETMNRIVKIAVRQMAICPSSEKFIRERFLEGCTNPLNTILEKLIECGRIKPINVRAIVCLLSRFAISAVMFQNTALHMGLDDWRTSLELAFSLIIPTGK